MTSSIIPSADLAPGMPSRVVTIAATDVTEGGFSLAGQKVTFALSHTLDATGGTVIARTSATITLDAAGKGSIRLPVYSSSVDAWPLRRAPHDPLGSDDWAIIVTTSWGSTKTIRVPAGTSTIALAALPDVRPLTPMESKWAITAAGITITEGAQWGATTSLDGGILTFNLTVPPGGTAYFRGPIGSADLDSLVETGVYTQAFGSNATEARHYPVLTSGVLQVAAQGTTVWQQYDADAGYGIWRRKGVDSAWGEWERISGSFTNRGLLGSADLDGVLTDGIHHQIYSSAATTARHYPVTTSGVLTVSVVPNPNRIYQAYQADAGLGTWRRIRTEGTWGAWERLTSTLQNRGLAGSADLDSLTGEGTWYQRYPGNITPERHYPVVATGQIEVRVLDASIGARAQEFWPDDQSLGAWRRVSMGSVWSAWAQIGGGTGADAAIGATVRRDRARSRKGGRIGTAGRGVVTLRFDDAHDAMAATVVPLLKQHKLPAYQAVTVRLVEEESSRTWAQIQELVGDGIEVFGHSWTHQAASGYGALRKEIVESAAYMEAQMPGVAIEGWVMPGTGEGADAYDGFGPGGTVEAWTETSAGRMILDRYAVPCGSIPGFLNPLTGTPITGQVHWTFEAETLAATQAMVRQAIRTGTGITLMAHPARFGTTGFMSVADLEALLAWIAAERDAERLLVLTGTGQAFADASTSQRMNVVAGLPDGWTGSGWTFADGVASTTTGGLLSHAAAAEGINHLRGSVFEATAMVHAPDGAVFRTQVTGGAAKSENHTIPAGGWHRVRMHFHLPTTAGVAAGLTGVFGRVSGGAVSMTDIAVRPI
ncbi:polysaccharide deacetylase family protein [Brachybacterium sp. DNPG3]